MENYPLPAFVDTVIQTVDIDTDTAPNTFIAVLGLEGAERLLEELTKKALDICDIISTFSSVNKEACTFLRDLAVYLLERNI